jgi:hypothetical protein
VLVVQSHGRTACAISVIVCNTGNARPDERAQKGGKARFEAVRPIEAEQREHVLSAAGQAVLHVGSSTQRCERLFDLQAPQGGTSRNGKNRDTRGMRREMSRPAGAYGIAPDGIRSNPPRRSHSWRPKPGLCPKMQEIRPRRAERQYRADTLRSFRPLLRRAIGKALKRERLA